jgi:hypothetical protein
MTASPTLRVNRWFVAACVLMLLTATAHSLGHFSPIPTDPATKALLAAMRGYTMDLGMGMKPSQWDVFNALSLTMTVSLAWLGCLGLLVAYSDMGRRTVQRTIIIFILGNGLLAGLYLFYRIPPPFVSLGTIEAVLLVAALRAPR